MHQKTLSSQELQYLQEQSKVRNHIITELYQYLVRSRVEGLMAVEFATDDFEKETDFITRYYKRAVHLMVRLIDEKEFQSAQQFYKEILLIQNQIKPEDVSLVFLIDELLEAFAYGDKEVFFRQAFFATQYLTQLPHDSVIVKTLLLQVAKLRAKLLYDTQDYPIKLDPKYPEVKDRIDEKMSIFLQLDDRDIQMIIRETQSTDLENILGLCKNEIKEKFLKNISHMAAEFMREDIEKKFYECDGKQISLDTIVKSVDILLLTKESVLSQ